jgi:hypothetical protein
MLSGSDSPSPYPLSFLWSADYIGAAVRQELAERWLAKPIFNFGTSHYLIKPFLSSDYVGSGHEAGHAISGIKVAIKDGHLEEAHCLQDLGAFNRPIRLRLYVSNLKNRL